MKKQFLFVTILFAFTLGCADNIYYQSSNSEGKIKFGISSGQRPMAKLGIASSPMISKNESIAAVLVSIEDSNGIMIHNQEYLKLFNMNGDYITKALALPVGTYKITEYFVIDSSNNVIYATPVEGSPKAYLVGDPLPIDFSIKKDIVTKLIPEVICVDGAAPEDFGYATFSFEVIPTFNFLISVMVYNELLNNYELSNCDISISGDGSPVYSSSLPPETNSISLPDGCSSYNIIITKKGYVNYSCEFTNSELKEYNNEPLVITLIVDNPSIAFFSTRDADDRLFDIFVMNDDGSNPVNITKNPRKYLRKLTWSPDGNKISFFTDEHIYVINADGSNLIELTTDLFNFNNTNWSPDNKKILFHAQPDYYKDIYTINADGSELTNLTNNKDTDSDPCWSPDGNKIVFHSRSYGTHEDDIYIMNSDGTEQINITNNPTYSDSTPIWSPNGEKIVFRAYHMDSDDALDSDLHVMNADGSGRTKITNDHFFEKNYSWSPDGTKILYQSKSINEEICIVNADGSDQVKLTDSGFNKYPCWSPDGTKIIYSAYQDGNMEIFVMNADGSNKVNLTNNSSRDYFSSWKR